MPFPRSYTRSLTEPEIELWLPEPPPAWPTWAPMWVGRRQRSHAATPLQTSVENRAAATPPELRLYSFQEQQFQAGGIRPGGIT